MSIFDLKWIVEIEYSDGFLSGNKKDTVIVDARSDYEAKQKIKKDPQFSHKYLWIRSVKLYNQNTKLDVEEESTPTRKLTQKEKEENEAQRRIYEKEFIEKQKQKELTIKEAKIRRINRSPITAGIVGGIITLIAFLLGWIPYWYWNYQRSIYKSNLETMYSLGHTMSEQYMQELYLEGLHAKEMKDSVIWIPLVILAVGIVLTIVVVVLKRKSKEKRLKELKTNVYN